MPTNIDPCVGTLGLENKKFALDENGNVVVRVGADEDLPVIQNPNPYKDTIPASQDFVDGGGSDDLNVDGSVTPVEYTIAPTGTDIIYVSGLSMWLEDKGSWTKNAFGAIVGGLTNGVLFELGRNGVFTTIGNLQNNFDVASIFNSGQAISLKDISGEIALIGTQPLEQLRNIRLDANNSDSIRVTVRDDLTGLDNFSMKAIAWRDE